MRSAHLEFFRVRRVEISGLHYLEAAKIVAALKLSPIGQRVRRFRGLWSDGSAHCREWSRRTLDGAFRGRCTSAWMKPTPWRCTPRAERLALVDASGACCPSIRWRRRRIFRSLIGGGRPVASALARTRDFDPGLFARIDAAWRVGPDVVFEVDGRWFWFGPELSAEDIER